MKKWKMMIPAIILVLICAALIVYEFYVSPAGGPHGHGPRPEGGLRPDGKHFEKNPLKEIFNWFGTMAIIGGAITYSWVLFKKKLKSQTPILKKFSKLLFRVHNVVGYSILIFGIAHGAYYLFTEKLAHKGMLSGIAAFVLLSSVGVYGFLIRRMKNKYTKKVHFWVSNASLLALIIHAGGSFIGPAIGALSVWGIVEIAERTVFQKQLAQE